MIEYLVPIAACAVLLAYFCSDYWNEYKRTRALQLIARNLGLEFSGSRDSKLAKQLGFFSRLPKGALPYCANLLYGYHLGHPVHVFDFFCWQQRGRGWDKVNATCFVIFLGKQFPTLQIYPETAVEKIAQALGGEDIDFESVEFSNAFVVKSEDKKFAYDVCHVRLMQHFLGRPFLAVDIEREYLALVSTPRAELDEIKDCLDEAINIRELMPAYLFE